MEEQGIPREHLSKMIALQKETMSELYEKNTQLKKDNANLRENVNLLVQELDNTLHALMCKESYQCEYLDENLSRLEYMIVNYKKGD